MLWHCRLAVGAASIAPVDACDFVGVVHCSISGPQEFLRRLLAQPVQLIRCSALQREHHPLILLCKVVLGFWLECLKRRMGMNWTL